MAKKTLRLHNYAQNNSGWHNSIFPPANALGQLASDCNKIATSIPSPFAQFDLAKDAFGKIAESKKFAGNSPQHKMISYILDVAQIFYQSKKFKTDIQIVAWDTNDINSLIDSDVLMDSLRTYWLQDADVYDFDKVQQLFFLIYKNDIIGSTSPTTLFVASPDCTEIGIDLNSGMHKYFSDIRALHERDEDFILYFYQLVYQDRQVLSLNELRKYLQAILDNKLLSQNLRGAILNVQFPTYPTCEISPGNGCYVGTHTLGLALPMIDKIRSESDFVIKSDYSHKVLPLVLPNAKYNKPWNYTVKGDTWNKDYEIPEKGGDQLPSNGELYPWLGISDFLEDKIILSPYAMDDDFKIQKDFPNVLLPLKREFFKYFDVNKIGSYLSIKRNPINNDCFIVDLKIPTTKGFVEFQKIYQKEHIVEWSGDIGILPFYKPTGRVNALKYTIGVVDSEEGNIDYPIINLYNGNQLLSPLNSKVRLDKDSSSDYAAFCKYSGVFDNITINISGTQGVIIPKLRSFTGNGSGMDITVDFGTTNTHIEYKINDVIEELNYSYDTNPLYKMMLVGDGDFTLSQQYCFEHLVLPKSINSRGKSGVSYPVRSALLEPVNGDKLTSYDIYLDGNCHLLHHEIFHKTKFNSVTKLKWENFKDAQSRARLDAYIESILLLLYYKAISLNKDLNDINITWFYPVSLSHYNLSVMENVWSQKYKQVFGADPAAHLSKMTESIAPYYCYRKTQRNLMGLSASIDIGGGSADISIFDSKRKEPVVISSFNFAGNAIFGDALGGSPVSNGFVQYFKEVILEQANSDEKKMLEVILQGSNSEEFSNFAFSMKKFDFLGEIQHSDDIKLCVLIYYASLIYYVAHFMKKNGYDAPANLMFSGNGSKTLKILDPSANSTSISKLFTRIFEHVMGTQNIKPIRIITNSDPKVLTCKGGLFVDVNSSNSEEDGLISTSLRYWVGGADSNKMSAIIREEEYESKITYDQICDEDLKSVKKSVEDLFAVCDKCLLKEVKLDQYFGIDLSAYDLFKNIRSKKIMEYLQHIRDEQGSDVVSQTLFFAPLIGIISDLASEIAINK